MNGQWARQQEIARGLTQEKAALAVQLNGRSPSGAKGAKVSAELKQTRRALDKAQQKLKHETEAATALAKEKEALLKSVEDSAKAAAELAQTQQTLEDKNRQWASNAKRPAR